MPGAYPLRTVYCVFQFHIEAKVTDIQNPGYAGISRSMLLKITMIDMHASYTYLCTQ